MVVAAGVELGGVESDEATDAGRPHPRRAVGLLQRLEQHHPLGGRGGGEDAAAAGDHRRHADPLQRGTRGGEVGVAVADHRDVAGRSARPSKVAPEVTSARMSCARSSASVGPHLRHRERLAAPAAEDRAPHDPHPQGRRARHARQPRLAMVRRHVVDDDPLVAQRGAAEQLLTASSRPASLRR